MDGWELACADLSAGYNDRALWVLGEGPRPDNIQKASVSDVRGWLNREVKRAATQEVLAGQTNAEGQTPTSKELGRMAAGLLIERNFRIGPMLDDERPVGALTLELLSDHSGSYALKISSRPTGCSNKSELILETVGSLVANEPQVVQLEVPPPDNIAGHTTRAPGHRPSAKCAQAWGTPWLEDSMRWDTAIELDQQTQEAPIHRVIKQWSNYHHLCRTDVRLIQSRGVNIGKNCVLMAPGELP
jgi:hypothetical protein